MRTLPFLVIAFAALAGCGGGSSSSSTTPSVALSASPASVSPGGLATLKWTSQNVTDVSSSNFGATAVAGSAQIGPLNVTTDYTITCTGPNGSATAHTTVVVKSGSATPIPTGVLLYSLQNTDGSSTLYYQAIAGGTPVTVTSFAAGVTVFGTDSTGTRLVLAEPVNNDPSKLGVFVTNLDGAGNPVRMGTETWTTVNDAAISVDNKVLVVKVPHPQGFTAAGVPLGGWADTTTFLSGSLNSTGTTGVVADGREIWTVNFPVFDGAVQIRSGGSYSWVRWSPAAPKLVYTDGADVWEMDSSGANAVKIATNASFPTFDNTGTRVFYARVGDGIYVKDLNAGTESKLTGISGAWNGRIVWH